MDSRCVVPAGSGRWGGGGPVAARRLLLVALLAISGCGPTEPNLSSADCDCPAVPMVQAVPAVESLLAAPVEPVDLRARERQVFSQQGEDGVLEAIFEIIEPTHRFAVEFGAADGIENSNVRNLVVNEGWGAFQIEGDPEQAAALARNYADYPKAQALEAWVWPGNIEILFEEAGVPRDFDLLVIDIDSNDYYVWRAIHEFRPKVVMIEANARYLPPRKMVIEFHPMNYWDGASYHGASLQSLYELGKRKGYELVYTNGINAIFVDGKFFPGFGIRDNSPVALYPEEYRKKIEKLPPPPDKPKGRYLTWDELRIEKRFRFDR